MTDRPQSSPAPLPAAAVILLRDGPNGLEVLMQHRREGASAFAGVVAFPGGKVAPVDADPGFSAAADLGPPEPFPHAHQLAALRELFEECAILFARKAEDRAALADRGPLLGERERLDREPALWPALLADRGLRLAADALVPWARWVTPDFAPRRFDSTLFAAAAPPDQPPIGGSEAETNLWARPEELIAAADREEIFLVFVTRMNLMRLAQYATVAEALAAGRCGPHPTIKPVRTPGPEGEMMMIGPEAPYPVRGLPFATSSVAVDARRRALAAAKRR